MMLLQESEKVNKTLDAEKKEIVLNYMMNPESGIVSISKDL